MPKIPFFKGKRSIIDLSLWTLIEIIAGIIILSVLFYYILRLSGLFLSGQEYQSTVNNLEALSNRVKELANDRKAVTTQTTVYSITDDYILAGFSYNDNGVRTECTGESIITSRPKLCQSKSCLCIYQNTGGITDWSGNDFDLKGDAAPVKCKPFEEKIVFLASTRDSNFFGTQANAKPSSNRWPSYNYLVLYGICGGFWRSSWGIKQVSLDKIREGENIFIVIGELNKKSDFKPSGGAIGGAGAQGTTH
ncbi:hypothetical protein HYX08_03940 [Candidatus Woesearchaeota archaeon]|nr:hypothetical protein [Candidatus Woesearchaeota archaeon]